jgi:hypothetical protein
VHSKPYSKTKQEVKNKRKFNLPNNKSIRIFLASVPLEGDGRMFVREQSIPIPVKVD